MLKETGLSTAPAGQRSLTPSPYITPPSLVTMLHKTFLSVHGELSLMEANKSPRNQRNKPVRTATRARTTLNRKALYETFKRYKQFKAAFAVGEFCPYSKTPPDKWLHGKLVQYSNVTSFINFKQILPSVENVNRSSLNNKWFAKECRLKNRSYKCYQP